MNQRALAAAALAVAAVGGGIYATSGDKTVKQDAVTVLDGGVDAGVTRTRKRTVKGPFDAGANPIVTRSETPTIRGADGGTFRLVSTSIVDPDDPDNRQDALTMEPAVPDCLRRPKNVANKDCRWAKRLLDGTITPTDVPPGYRFPADAGLGTQCVPVACAVIVGEKIRD